MRADRQRNKEREAPHPMGVGASPAGAGNVPKSIPKAGIERRGNKDSKESI